MTSGSRITTERCQTEALTSQQCLSVSRRPFLFSSANSRGRGSCSKAKKRTLSTTLGGNPWLSGALGLSIGTTTLMSRTFRVSLIRVLRSLGYNQGYQHYLLRCLRLLRLYSSLQDTGRIGLRWVSITSISQVFKFQGTSTPNHQLLTAGQLRLTLVRSVFWALESRYPRMRSR